MRSMDAVRAVRPARSWALLAVLAWSLAAIPGARADETASPASTRYAQIRRVCAPTAPGDAACMALVRVPAASTTPDAIPYTANDGASSSGPAGGLTPAQLASAYGYDPTSGGSGQTVAIVDAFDDPSIEKNLGEFDSHYKLAACTTANGCFEKVGQSGSAGSLPKADKTGWSVEISLDVETVHAACPNCKILLVEAENESFKDLARAVDEAVTLGASEVSNSYAGPETEQGASERAAYSHPGVVIAAATGDDGYYDWDAINESGSSADMPNAPASLPSVLAVGGTTLELSTSGARAKETVWNENGPGDAIGLAEGFPQGATGGGCSTLFTAPLWQQSAPDFAASGCGDKRLSADVAAVGNPQTGFDIYDTYDCGAECEAFGIGKGKGWVTVGGTSLATPFITALYALAGGAHGVSDPALTLYGHLGDPSSLYDVTEGGNGFCGSEALTLCDQPTPPSSRYGQVDCEGTTACNAAPGLDGPSGVGTPNGLGAFEPLLPTAAITAPSSLEPGVAAGFSASASSDPYPGGSIASYSWEWGDGSADSGGVSPTHTFAAAGTYLVTLTVTDNYGLTSAAVTRSVKVGEESSEEEATKRKHEEEAAARKAHEEEIAAGERHEEEAAANKTREEAAVTGKREEEAAANKTREEELATSRLEEERVAAGKAHEEEVAAKDGEERATASRHEEEEAAAGKRREEEAVARRREEERSAIAPGLQGAAGFQSLVASPIPDAQLAGTALTASSSGIVILKLSCPGGETSCAGTVTLRTLGAVSSVGGHATGKAAAKTIATASFTVAGGKLVAVKLHLPAWARALLARSRLLRARATILAHDPAGATHVGQTIVTLRPVPKPGRHGNG